MLLELSLHVSNRVTGNHSTSYASHVSCETSVSRRRGSAPPSDPSVFQIFFNVTVELTRHADSVHARQQCIDSQPLGRPRFSWVHDCRLTLKKGCRTTVHTFHIVLHVEEGTIVTSVVVELLLCLEQPTHLARTNRTQVRWHGRLREFGHLPWDVVTFHVVFVVVVWVSFVAHGETDSF